MSNAIDGQKSMDMCPHGALSRETCAICSGESAKPAYKRFADFQSMRREDDLDGMKKNIQELRTFFLDSESATDEIDWKQLEEHVQFLVLLGTHELGGLAVSRMLRSDMFARYLSEDPELKTIVETSNMATERSFPTYATWQQNESATPPDFTKEARTLLDLVALYTNAHQESNGRLVSQRKISDFDSQKLVEEIGLLGSAYESLTQKLLDSFKDGYGADSYEEMSRLLERLSVIEQGIDPELLEQGKDILDARTTKSKAPYAELFETEKRGARIEAEIDELYPERPGDSVFTRFRDILKAHASYYPLEIGESSTTEQHLMDQVWPEHSKRELIHALTNRIEEIQQGRTESGDDEPDRLVSLLQGEIDRIRMIVDAQSKKSIDE